MNHKAPLKLRIPRTDRDSFSHFSLNGDAAQAWSDCLPVADALHTARQLRRAIADLNRVQLVPELRFTIMEILRPNMLVVLTNLSRGFLTQSLVLRENQKEMATLVENLYSLATTAYTVIAVHTIQQRDRIEGFNPARLVSEAVHRSLTFCGDNLLLAMQLYQRPQSHLWLTLHQLFVLAERQQLTTLPVTDPVNGSSTIASAYIRVLMLGCAKPNQLRQTDMAGVYRGLQNWSKYIELRPAGDQHGLFVVDLNADQPPAYSQIHTGAPNDSHRYLHTDALLAHLEEVRARCRRQGRPGIQFDEHFGIACNILDHLALSLGTMSLRNYRRIPSDDTLAVGVGLHCAHYRVAGGKNLYEVMGDAYAGQFSDRDYPSPPENNTVTRSQPHKRTDDRLLVHNITLFNASPGGYGLDWPGELTESLRTGTLLCTREGDTQDWAVASVRWVRQRDSGAPEVGVELLSPTAIAYGALVHNNTGVEETPLRVLLLPEISLVGQPHTLVTPRLGFRDKQKLTLMRNGEEFMVQLTRPVAETAGFARYEFRYIKQLEEVLAEDKSGPVDFGYDSVWNNI
jgi:cyclic-di-GMP-binding protein